MDQNPKDWDPEIPLPPRRLKKKKRRFPVVMGISALVLSLTVGVFYAQGGFSPPEKSSSSEITKSGDQTPEKHLADAVKETETWEESTDSGEKPENGGMGKREEADGERIPAETKKSSPKESPSSSKPSSKSESKSESDSDQPKPSKDGPKPAKEEPKPPTPSREASSAEKKPDRGEEPAPPASLSSFERKVVVLVNGERTAKGLKPLQADAQLSDVARKKSADMRDNGYFSHHSPTYGSPSDMMSRFGVKYLAAAENIAAGQVSPESVVKGWMNSSEHRANILHPEFTHMGVGHAEGGSMGHYWTQQFIRK